MKSSKKIVRATALPQRAWAEYAKPFTVVPDAILDTDKLDPTDKVLIIALLRRLANRKKPAAVSVRSIARDWKLTHTTVSNRMQWFEIAGWLVKSEDKTTQGAGKYRIDFIRMAVWLGERGVAPSSRVPGSVEPGPGSQQPGGGSQERTPIPSQIPEGRRPFPDLAPTREGTPSFSGPGTGRVRYPKKIGKKYKNGIHGAFCTIRECGRELAQGEGWYLVGEDGAITYCPEHIHDAELRWKLGSVKRMLPPSR